jgi:hypothetical protein
MKFAETLVRQKSRRRLWWTLVIREWLAIPLRTLFTSDRDFTCRLPLVISDAQLAYSGCAIIKASSHELCLVEYHIVMAAIAKIFHQLHVKFRLRRLSPAQVAARVIQADDQLADVIEHLPSHLRHNADISIKEREELEQRLPWIATQKTRLIVVLLYYRLAINRILQAYWIEGSTNFERARSICLSSAVGLVYSVTSF